MSWKALSQNLRELRIHLCQRSAGSQGVRDFVKSMYAPIKQDNPGFPMLIREAEGVPARMTARFEFGVEKSVPLEGLDKQGIQTALESLIREAPTPAK